jgi:hypothetical protein
MCFAITVNWLGGRPEPAPISDLEVSAATGSPLMEKPVAQAQGSRP